ncbi:non-structural protein [Ambidensovirus_Croatia_17_S17]|uniref:Non-structural protein n=1 Tax=Ambidensovirus_Croatia_17_S17 TaxID=3070156 RepID=A0A6C0PVQ3_9VIRU|nr:non-structural protein [Ambidensovirus_Croatia_17_S17]QHY93491.1 non-structural protein [Ambidensovirus_Croatia_17_S17]
MDRVRVLPKWMTTFNPKSLRSLAMNAVQRVYKHDWHLVREIPKSLQEELLEAWLQCEESVPVSDDDLEKVEAVVCRGWKGMRPWSPQVFVYIMMLPNELPCFAFEDNHVIFEYYLWKRQNCEMNLCVPCFISVSKEYKQYSANYWLDKGWQFYKVKNHIRVKGDGLLYVLWDRSSWCDRCICEPLIYDIIDYEDCYYDYHYHKKRRCTRCYDSSSDSDSDTDWQTRSLVGGRRTDPKMYEMMKQNKHFEWYCLFYF